MSWAIRADSKVEPEARDELKLRQILGQKAKPGESPQAAVPESDRVDGRRARSERSRAKIVDAVMKLVQGGEIQPDPQKVADLAKVSLRTVYRHFDDSESLFKELSVVCEKMCMPIFMQPYTSTHWTDQIRENLDRRVQVFEQIMHFRIATSARRFRSATLMRDYKRYVRLERLGVESLLPAELKSDTDILEAIDVLLCFETYQRLRLENGHSPSKAKEILEKMLDSMLIGFVR